jgi:hypothetical protein
MNLALFDQTWHRHAVGTFSDGMDELDVLNALQRTHRLARLRVRPGGD